MAEYLVQGESITVVADAIREKGGTTAPLSFPAGMAEAVRNIQSGADLSLDITGATPGQIAKISAVDTDGKPAQWEPVDIPSGGTDISLGLTAATVGQTIKVKAVDTDGKPTEWEAVDAAGGETWEKIADVAFTADTSIYNVANFGIYRKVKVLMSRAKYVSGLNKNVWFRVRRTNASLGVEVAAVYLNTQYGYLTWEVNAEVDAFIYVSRHATNNPVSAEPIVKTVAILPPVEPGSLKFNIEFTDTSVIQDGDTVTVYGVKR